MATKVIMPKLGESVVEGTVTKWLVKEGQTIQELAPLLEINTDKVDTEIPSSVSGTLLKILVEEGTTVEAGTTLAWIGNPGESIPEEMVPVGDKLAEQASTPVKPAPIPSAPLQDAKSDLGFISPVVAKMAGEYKIDLQKVKGTGDGGRITKKDVQMYLEAQKSTPPAPAEEKQAWETPGEGDLFRPTEMMFAKEEKPAPPPPGTDQIIPLTAIRKRIAEHMVMSKHTSAHVTTVMEADLQRVVAHREANRPLFAKDGVNLTYTAYFIAAAVAALKANPLVNSSWSDQGIVVHTSVHVGLAVSLGEDGLIVPVIKDTDRLSLLGIARSVKDLAERARARRLLPDEVRGGTFSITNYGIGGSLFATPIINQPQSAILGVGAIKKRVVALEGDAIAIRPMVYLSLTFDHRILDGASGDKFLAKVVATLENYPL
jgi:pyruvate/2-oxoglutarate dehydrogenase complex dihydrolipoamide acyltransferase (E2) component